jgi:hypothetical protein
MTRWWLALPFLTLGCQGLTAPTVALDREFVLAPGESARVAQTESTVRFVGVEGDSRCPADALCIQGGDAVVRIEVWGAGGPAERYALHTGDMKPVAHEDLTIELVQLQPYPFSSRTIAPSDYRATLRVSR